MAPLSGQFPQQQAQWDIPDIKQLLNMSGQVFGNGGQKMLL